MKRIIVNIKPDFLEKTSLATISLLAGLILSRLFDKYIDYFSILLIFVLAFLFIYHKHAQNVDDIAKVLAHCYGRCQGDIKYYDDPQVFYGVASNYLSEAEREILIYNDYFGQDKLVLGYNTTTQYFNSLENIIKKNSKKPEFKMSCIICSESIKGAILSEKYANHLHKLFSLASACVAPDKIQPFIHADKRIVYASFTIIDASILRISLEGIYRESDGPSSKVIGGFIIKDNNEIIEHFRSLYYHTLRQSISYNSVEEVNEAIK